MNSKSGTVRRGGGAETQGQCGVRHLFLPLLIAQTSWWEEVPEAEVPT